MRTRAQPPGPGSSSAAAALSLLRPRVRPLCVLCSAQQRGLQHRESRQQRQGVTEEGWVLGLTQKAPEVNKASAGRWAASTPRLQGSSQGGVPLSRGTWACGPWCQRTSLSGNLGISAMMSAMMAPL